jgi:hypothetical protein
VVLGLVSGAADIEYAFRGNCTATDAFINAAGISNDELSDFEDFRTGDRRHGVGPS